MKYIFRNARIVLPDRVMKGSVVTEDNLIKEISREDCKAEQATEIDCQGLYLSPGFVDIHIHGGGGADFMDGKEESVHTVLETHAKYGTTSMLPTTLSCSQEKVIAALKTIQSVQKQWQSGPRILGAHLEGNFFSMARKGAQDPEYIFPPTPENYLPIINSVSNIKRISCAPETENALIFADEMIKKEILISIAHSDADYDQVIEGVKHGFSHVTHIFNGCSFISSPDYYCKVGVSESAMLLDEICAEVIADGRHIPKELLKLLYKVKGPEHLHLCTDAMSATGMPEGGEYKLGALDVVIRDSVAVLKHQNSFAGSVSTTDRLVRTMYHTAEVPLHDAVRMITATPAKQIREYQRLGSIGVGKLADLNIFNEDIQVKFTMIDGRIYRNEL